jgi:D-3-phosphoglycerate dehydrogenase / 2-oxoglutarate reductase
MLGDAGVNIAEYHQARLQAGGQAIAAISVDGKLSLELLTSLRELPDILEVKQAELD